MITTGHEGPWTVEYWDDNQDYPSWNDEGNYRSLIKAMNYAAQQNQVILNQQNQRNRQYYESRLRQWREQQILIDAGARPGPNGPPPVEPVVLTECPMIRFRPTMRWYRVKPMEFEDD